MEGFTKILLDSFSESDRILRIQDLARIIPDLDLGIYMNK
jgi:hypothetical protein